jgi:acyl-CoA synthetase (AMP-forming)/AMP-acid ligase II
VAILALNNELYLEALFALPHAGAWAVPCNVRLAVAELSPLLHDAGPGRFVSAWPAADGADAAAADGLPLAWFALFDAANVSSDAFAWASVAARVGRVLGDTASPRVHDTLPRWASALER